MTRYEVLPPSQACLLPILMPLRELGLVLYGGTAIALQLGHRGSIGFDFFTDRRSLFSPACRPAKRSKR